MELSYIKKGVLFSELEIIVFNGIYNIGSIKYIRRTNASGIIYDKKILNKDRHFLFFDKIAKSILKDFKINQVKEIIIYSHEPQFWINYGVEDIMIKIIELI